MEVNFEFVTVVVAVAFVAVVITFVVSIAFVVVVAVVITFVVRIASVVVVAVAFVKTDVINIGVVSIVV